MFQINIQSLLHVTRSGLGHQRKPVEHEVFLQGSPWSNWRTIRETLQNHKYIVNVCMLDLIEERYEKLSKTISISLMYACAYIQDDAK